MLKIGAETLAKVSHDHVAIIHVTGILLFLHCIACRFVLLRCSIDVGR